MVQPKTRFYCLLILLVFVFMACNEHKNEQNNTTTINENKTNSQFKKFLKRFQTIKLPLLFEPCSNPPKDLLFSNALFEQYIPKDRILYAQLKIKQDFIAIITLKIADCYVPVLSTFNPNGRKIDEKEILIGRCGLGCGFVCNEWLTINENLDFFTRDSITQYGCDSNGIESKEIKEKYVLIKTGHIGKDGTISISTEEKRKLLK